MVDVNPEVVFHGERPHDFIIGVINEEHQMESTVSELQASGYAGDSITVLHGKSGAEALHRRGEQPGTTSRAQRIRSFLDAFASGSMDDVKRHEEAAEQGNYVVGVRLPRDEVGPREEVRQILKSHGGYDIILVAGRTVELLDE